jgi:cysteine desulfurase family protein (TIGR01976 family)
MTLDPTTIRSMFPALSAKRIYFDNPGGTQVPQHVIERMRRYLVDTNANCGGAFAASRATDEMVLQARQGMADFYHAASPDEIVFGPNMTTLTFAISRCLAHDVKQGDELIVTHLDHDANIAPWLAIAQERECVVRWLAFDPTDCTLDLAQLEELLNERTRLVAVGYASNAVGTINPVRRIADLAHAAGALCFVDAVHYAPHGPIDVQDLNCDFLVTSAYKFFGPHVGVLYGKMDLLQRLHAYKVRPVPDLPPHKFESGTQNLEGMAGLLGALAYLIELGERCGAEHAERFSGQFSGQALSLKKAMAAIRAYELELSRALLDVVEEVPGLHVYGLTDRRRLDARVPTVSFTLQGQHPRRVAEELDKADISVWDGNYYALAVTERLGLEKSGGMVRVGPVHYNTAEEIERFGEALVKIAAGAA